MTDPDDRIWRDVLAHLRTYSPAISRQWFEELDCLGLDGGVLWVRAASAVQRDHLRRDCTPAFNDAARAVTGALVSVHFLAPEETPQSVRAGAHAAIRTNGSANDPALFEIERLSINPECTFENFVIGHNNRLAHAFAVAVADRPGREFNPLFIHGGVGLGKTHLLQAICLRILQAQPGARVLYLSCDGFMSRFIESIQQGSVAQFRSVFRNVDVLVLDDIHFLAKRESSQEEFFHTFNALYQSSKQVVLSSDAAPEDIPLLEQRLVSRFKQGLVNHIGPPEFETRVNILKKKAQLRGSDLPDDAAAHIASRIDTNIRELEGAINTLLLQASVEKRPVDLALAQAAFGHAVAETPADITIQTVMNAVTEFYGVRLTDIQGKRRHRSIALPRQVCMYLARRYTRHSLEEIGGHFGGRDHTTVMHAIKTVDTRRQSDEDLESALKRFEDRFQRNSLS